MRNGADVLVESLRHFGVRHLFGMPGSHSTTIYDAIARRPGLIETILIRNEQAGAFAADGYARVTGRPGVVCTTAGPGATNALSGVAECWADSVPILLVSGQVNAATLDRECGNYHEIDLERIFQPATKWCGTVRHVEQIPAYVASAFQAMTTGRPRPAAIFLPQDLMRAPCSDIGPSARFPIAPRLPRSGRGDRAGRRAALAARDGRSSWPAAARSGRARPQPSKRLAAPPGCSGRDHAERQGPARRAPSLLARPCAVARAKMRSPARRRDARRRLPFHRSDDRLAAHDRARQLDPDRSRRRARSA